MRTTTTLLVLLALAGCSDATSPSPSELQAARTRWQGHFIRDYQYLYEQTGFNTAISGRTILVVVIGDTVRMANDTLTGDSVPVAWAVMPTVTGLFDIASRALSSGSLNRVVFDPSLDYPSRIDIAGPPDASGSIFAKQLQPLLTATPIRR